MDGGEDYHLDISVDPAFTFEDEDLYVLPSVVFNEINCNGESWIEILSLSEQEISLGGWLIQVQQDENIHILDESMILPAYGRYLLTPESENQPNGYSFDYNCGEDELALYDARGFLVDSVSPAECLPGYSWGRFPDGVGEWQSTVLTPGAANQVSFQNSPRINEVNCHAPDWIELYNPDEEAINLVGWSLGDDSEVEGAGLLPEITLEAGEHLYLNRNGDALDGAVEGFEFGVRCGEETIYLFDPSGVVVDSLEVPDTHELHSYGSVEDGGYFRGFLFPTPGEENEEIPRMALNEISCHGEDWVELLNFGSRLVNLRGWTLVEDEEMSGGFVFESDINVPPEGFVVVSSQTAQVEPVDGIFDFRLGCGGDTLSIYDEELRYVDGIDLPLVYGTAAYGRIPDGSGYWSQTSPTAGLENREHQASIIFGTEMLSTVTLYLGVEQYADLMNAADAYVSAMVSIQSSLYAEGNIGMRLKGSFTAMPIFLKPSIKLDFNWSVEGQTLFDMERLNLHNLSQDPVLVREPMAYLFFSEMGIPASRTGFGWVSLIVGDLEAEEEPGVDMSSVEVGWEEQKGIYLIHETYDDAFLSQYYTGTQHLYEGTVQSDLVPDGLDQFEVDEGSEADITNLENLVYLLDGAAPETRYQLTQDIIDWEAVIMFLATENFIGHFDGYSRGAKNFYLHVDDDGVFSLLPSSLELTFHVNESYRVIESGDSILVDACLRDSTCLADYIDALNELADFTESFDFTGYFDSIDGLIESYFPIEPYLNIDPEVRDKELENLVELMKQRASEMRCLDYYGDVASTDACPECKVVDSGMSGLHLICPSSRSYEDSISRCEEEGAYLDIQLRQAEENADIVIDIRRMVEGVFPQNYWIGIGENLETGLFETSLGAPVEEQQLTGLWAPGQPVYTEGQDCVFLYALEELLYLAPCEEEMGFVCDYIREDTGQ